MKQRWISFRSAKSSLGEVLSTIGLRQVQLIVLARDQSITSRGRWVWRNWVEASISWSFQELVAKLWWCHMWLTDPIAATPSAVSANWNIKTRGWVKKMSCAYPPRLLKLVAVACDMIWATEEMAHRNRTIYLYSWYWAALEHQPIATRASKYSAERTTKYMQWLCHDEQEQYYQYCWVAIKSHSQPFWYPDRSLPKCPPEMILL